MQKLVISDDEGQTTVVPLVWDELSIGRAEGNTVRLTERNVSRRHARLSRDASGDLVVEDLGSYNGVRVNDAPIDGPRRLAAGDRIGVGDYVLELRDEASEAELAPDRRTTARHRVDRTTPPPAEVAATPAPRPARLVMLSQPAPGAEFALSGERLEVGRSEERDVWINHRSISRLHAEVIADDGGWVLRDAGSSNGIRVNGRRVESARLAAGDVLDLGHVRLRFVAPGEDYRFSLDRTVELARLPARRPGPGRGVTIGVGVGVVGVAAALGIGLRLDDGGDAAASPAPREAPPRARAATADPAGRVEAAAPVPAGEAAASGAQAPGAGDGHLDRCRAAVDDARWDDALAAVAAAPDPSPEIAACGALATRRVAERGTFERALRRLRGGDLAGAHFLLGGLPPDSPYRETPEAFEVFRARAGAELERLEVLADRDPREARRGLDGLLEVPDLDPAVAGRARRLREVLPAAAAPVAAGGP